MASESMVITEAERKEIGPLRQPRAHGGIGGPSWDTRHVHGISNLLKDEGDGRITEG